jgi:hypothetical protein
MAYEKVKAERYSNFGGLNTKISKYQTDQQQVIRLINYDFSTPGALTKRPSFNYFGGASFGGFITQLYQYEKVDGTTYSVVFGQSGAFLSGNTTTQLYPNIYPGASGLFGYTLTYTSTVGQTYVPSIQTLNDMLYVAAPQYWVSWDTNQLVNLPAANNAPFAYPVQPNVIAPNGLSYVVGPNVATSFFTTSLSYRWYLSAVKGMSRTIYGGTPFTPPYLFLNNRVRAPTWAGVADLGATCVDINFFVDFLNDAIANGASYLLVYRQILGITGGQRELNPVPLTTTIFQVPMASYASGFSFFRDMGTYAFGSGANFPPLGETASALYPQHNYISFNQSWSNWGNAKPQDGQYLEQSNPSIIEAYNNMMILAGFPSASSRVYVSNFAAPYENGGFGGGPEYVDAENYFDVQTEDGDVVSNITAYGTECVVAKRKSFFSLSGTQPDVDTMTFTLKSDQYGIISKRGACTWENYLWFLDRKGIVQYNGANFDIVSTPVEDIFKRMNYAWAQEIAILSHQKMRNEIWCCIPVDGATYNNIVVVYDYVSRGWTTFEGVNASALIATALTMPFPAPTIGASGGRMAQMGQSNFADFGGVYTTGVRFPFVTNYGWSTDQVFRRLFVDTDPIIGNNRAFQINLYGNMLNTASYSIAATFGATYQYRIDFGVYGKSISVELFEASTFALKLNGYTVVSRFQRNV